MRAPKLTSDLITDVKLHTFQPDDDNAHFTDANLLRLAQQKTEEDIYPRITDAKEHCLTAIHDVPLLAGASFDQPGGYQIPIDSMMKIESVAYVDAQGRECALAPYGEEEWNKYGSYSYHGTGKPEGFAFRGANLVVFPHPASVQTGERIRIRYVARPLTMVIESSLVFYAALITTPTDSAGTITYSMDMTIEGTQWDDGSNDFRYDTTILSASAPHVPVEHFLTGGNVGASISADQMILGSSNFEDFWLKSYTGKNPSRARKGDLVIANYESPIIQLPHEAYGLLVRGVAADVCNAVGDQAGFSRHERIYRDGLDALPGKLAQRAIVSPKVHVHHNSPGRVFGGRGWRR